MESRFQHHQLDNGLDILAESNPDAHSFAAGMFVKTGARDESRRINGVSHFLEHMMFKGSKRYTWEDVNRIFDEIGARYNAFTSQEVTAYHANVLPEFTDRAIEHLAQLLRPAIREADFVMEKKVILEEIAMYLDDPGHRIYEALMETHFGSHPLSMSVLGTAESIAKLDRQQMSSYFESRYGPGNMVVACSGRLEFGHIIDQVERYCADWPAVNAPRDQPAPLYKARRHRVVDPKLNRHYTMALMPGPSAQDPRRFAARVLADVIGDADGSRYYWALVDNAMAEEADLGFYPHDGCGSFYVSLVSSPDRSQQALEVAREELRKVRLDLTDAEIDRAKNKLATGLVMSGEIPEGRMRSIGTQWIYNHDYRSLEQELKSLQAVDRHSLSELMEAFPFAPMTIVEMGPDLPEDKPEL